MPSIRSENPILFPPTKHIHSYNIKLMNSGVATCASRYVGSMSWTTRERLTDADLLEEVKEVANERNGLANLVLGSIKALEERLDFGHDLLENVVKAELVQPRKKNTYTPRRPPPQGLLLFERRWRPASATTGACAAGEAMATEAATTAVAAKIRVNCMMERWLLEELVKELEELGASTRVLLCSSHRAYHLYVLS